MAEIQIPKRMIMELDSFLATKTCTDIDRTKFITFDFNKAKDNVNKLTTCLVFNCNCHSYEDPTIIPCEYTGAVVYLPAFWLEVPKELAFSYILKLLKNDLYGDVYRDWILGGLTGSSDPNGSGNNSSVIGCNCACGDWKEV